MPTDRKSLNQAFWDLGLRFQWDEKVWATFIEGNHTVEFDDKTLRLNAGVRYVHTDQTIGGRVTITDPPDGSPLGPINVPSTTAPRGTVSGRSSRCPALISIGVPGPPGRNWP